ncbi:peptidoglycan bridge formation glycyltransferase FemA/FemB family protein [Clostridium thermobutyricum]|uniref:peptidoglycan bridge formation glycyltransferase FemA/FemB family protein n=1 Tax=Clostridium thermobutyricum TaxID=29372 RepID=UPI0018AC5133|nr:peptidoglycan bridge formation glycyltransferase FemA/FemB family protein [Clostridium thermobutyricum]
MNSNVDIYFKENYAKLYERIEQGIVEKFNFKCNYGEIINLFIKRKIPNTDYFDLTTPYGYGGPRIISCKKGEEYNLVELYEKDFKEYCKKNNIIAEFVRFHPVIKNHKFFEKIYDIHLDRYTLGTNLCDYSNPIECEFSKSCKKNIKKAIKAGVSFEIEEKVNNIDEFIKIYYSTMKRNSASDFYYFDKEYFYQSLDYFRENIILVKAIFNNNVIAAGFYFIWDKIIHIHLSGTLSEYLYLSPAYILRYAVTLWGIENGYKLIHHGGGRSPSEEDGLYKFKKNFSKNTKFEFYLGKKIWNKDIYKKLSENIPNEIEYFPKYRYKEK